MALPRYSVTDAYILEELRQEYEASEPKRRVRILRKLQKQCKLPLDIAWLAVKDSSTEARRWFARHGRFSFDGEKEDELIRALLSDPDPFVRACLNENPSALGALNPEGNWNRYFKGITHVERLALVRNPAVDVKLIERIFDFNDEALGELEIDEDSRKELELGIGVEERKELALAFLSNEKRLHRLAHEACVCPEHDPSDYYEDFYFTSPYASRDADRFLSAIWELASKWPADPESGDRSDVAATVFRSVAVNRETMRRIYFACTDPDLRLNILDGCRGPHGDEETIRLALQDTDEGCRECAYSMLCHVAFSEVEELLQRCDKAALSGLARNRSVPISALEKIKEWFDKHDPSDHVVSFQISSILAGRHHEGGEEKSRPGTEPEIMPRASPRSDWLAEILTYFFPSGRAVFFIWLFAAILKLSAWHVVALYFIYLGLERLDRWHVHKEKQRAIDDEILGWERDPDDPEFENKGNLLRIRLTGQNQIILTRVSDLLRRIP